MLKKKDLKPGIAYSHEEIKHLLVNKYSDRGESKQLPKSQVSAFNLKVFNEIAQRIRKKFPDAGIYATGSRTTDKYREDSDFDIFVIIDRIYWPEIRSWQFDYKVDFTFNETHGFAI